MAQSGNNLLGDQSLAADGALLALGQAVLGAGSGNCGDNFLGVAQSSSLVSDIGVAADGAGIGGEAALGAGGSSHSSIVAVLMGQGHIQNDLRQGAELHACIRTICHTPVVAVADLSVAADAVTGKAAHLHEAVQGQGLLIPVLGDRHGDDLRNGAEIILAIGGTAAVGVGIAKLIGVGDLAVEIVLGCEFLGRVGQAADSDLNGLAGLQLLIQRKCVALAVGHGNGGLGSGDHLIGGNAVLLQTDDVAAGGHAGDGDLTGLGIDGHALRGELAEGELLLADSASVDGDGDALIGCEGNDSALLAVVELRRMLGIEDRAVAGHVALDAGAVLADTDHEHAGPVGPDSGQAVAAAFTAQAAGCGQLAVHGVIGHEDDGGTLAGCSHGGCAGVVGIGDDGYDIVALDVDDLVLKIRNGDLVIGVAVDGLPITEHVQSLDLADIEIDIALVIDVHVDVAQVEAVVLEIAVNGIRIEFTLGSGVIHKEHGLGDGDSLSICLGGLEVPVCNRVIIGMLDTDECTAAEGGELIDDGVIHILHLDGLGEAVGEGAGQGTGGDDGTLGRDDSEVLEDQRNDDLAGGGGLAGQLTGIVLACIAAAGGGTIGKACQCRKQIGVSCGAADGDTLGIADHNGSLLVDFAGIEGCFKGDLHKVQCGAGRHRCAHADDAVGLPHDPGDVLRNLDNAIDIGQRVALDHCAAADGIDRIECRSNALGGGDMDIVGVRGVRDGQRNRVGGLLVCGSSAIGGGELQNIDAGNGV